MKTLITKIEEKKWFHQYPIPGPTANIFVEHPVVFYFNFFINAQGWVSEQARRNKAVSCVQEGWGWTWNTVNSIQLFYIVVLNLEQLDF